MCQLLIPHLLQWHGSIQPGSGAGSRSGGNRILGSWAERLLCVAWCNHTAHERTRSASPQSNDKRRTGCEVYHGSDWTLRPHGATEWKPGGCWVILGCRCIVFFWIPHSDWEFPVSYERWLKVEEDNVVGKHLRRGWRTSSAHSDVMRS